jgi:cell division protein FtsW (lipid II flippase)
MKILHRISLVLIAVPLAKMLWSSLSMVMYDESLQARRVYYDENWIHEIGYARLTIAILSLLILLIPYRKGERWSFVALAVLMVCYILPEGFFLSMTHLGRWPILREFSSGPRLIGLAAVDFERHFFPALAFAGLAIAVPNFITSRRNTQLKDIQTL